MLNENENVTKINKTVVPQIKTTSEISHESQKRNPKQTIRILTTELEDVSYCLSAGFARALVLPTALPPAGYVRVIQRPKRVMGSGVMVRLKYL